MAISPGKFGASVIPLVMCWLQEEMVSRHKAFHLSNFFVDVSSQAADWHGPLDKYPASEIINERDNAQWGPQILWDPNPNNNIWVHDKSILVEYDGMVQVSTGTSVRVDRDVKEQVWRPL